MVAKLHDLWVYNLRKILYSIVSGARATRVDACRFNTHQPFSPLDIVGIMFSFWDGPFLGDIRSHQVSKVAAAEDPSAALLQEAAEVPDFFGERQYVVVFLPPKKNEGRGNVLNPLVLGVNEVF